MKIGTTLSFDKSVLETLKRLAARRGQSASAFANELLGKSLPKVEGAGTPDFFELQVVNAASSLPRRGRA